MEMFSVNAPGSQQRTVHLIGLRESQLVRLQEAGTVNQLAALVHGFDSKAMAWADVPAPDADELVSLVPADDEDEALGPETLSAMR